VGAPFNAQVQSEYSHSITEGFDGFIRGLAVIHGVSQNDPINPYDDIGAYTTVNLYGGVRDPDGRWALTVFAKNLFDTQRVLTRGATPISTSLQILATGISVESPYRAITVTPEREVGVNLRYNF
jgi:iron complex outermembrane receptor protein